MILPIGLFILVVILLIALIRQCRYNDALKNTIEMEKKANIILELEKKDLIVENMQLKNRLGEK